jgi:HEPN domain-containing protein
MPLDDAVLEVVREWVRKADHDLIAAAHTLKLKRNCPTDTVCFHAQQCVEKYLKAVLTLYAIAFPRTHDVEALVRILPPDMLIDWPLSQQRQLSGYAVVTRYPGQYEEIPLKEARQAVAIARRTRRELRKRLPRTALRKPNAKKREVGRQ